MGLVTAGTFHESANTNINKKRTNLYEVPSIDEKDSSGNSSVSASGSGSDKGNDDALNNRVVDDQSSIIQDQSPKSTVSLLDNISVSELVEEGADKKLQKKKRISKGESKTSHNLASAKEAFSKFHQNADKSKQEKQHKEHEELGRQRSSADASPSQNIQQQRATEQEEDQTFSTVFSGLKSSLKAQQRQIGLSKQVSYDQSATLRTSLIMKRFDSKKSQIGQTNAQLQQYSRLRIKKQFTTVGQKDQSPKNNSSLSVGTMAFRGDDIISKQDDIDESKSTQPKTSPERASFLLKGDYAQKQNMMYRTQTSILSRAAKKKTNFFNRKQTIVEEFSSVKSLTEEEKLQQAKQEKKEEMLKVAQEKVKQDLAHQFKLKRNLQPSEALSPHQTQISNPIQRSLKQQLQLLNNYKKTKSKMLNLDRTVESPTKAKVVDSKMLIQNRVLKRRRVLSKSRSRSNSGQKRKRSSSPYKNDSLKKNESQNRKYRRHNNNKNNLLNQTINKLSGDVRRIMVSPVADREQCQQSPNDIETISRSSDNASCLNQHDSDSTKQQLTTDETFLFIPDSAVGPIIEEQMMSVDDTGKGGSSCQQNANSITGTTEDLVEIAPPPLDLVEYEEPKLLANRTEQRLHHEEGDDISFSVDEQMKVFNCRSTPDSQQHCATRSSLLRAIAEEQQRRRQPLQIQQKCQNLNEASMNAIEDMKEQMMMVHHQYQHGTNADSLNMIDINTLSADPTTPEALIYQKQHNQNPPQQNTCFSGMLIDSSSEDMITFSTILDQKQAILASSAKIDDKSASGKKKKTNINPLRNSHSAAIGKTTTTRTAAGGFSGSVGQSCQLQPSTQRRLGGRKTLTMSGVGGCGGNFNTITFHHENSNQSRRCLQNPMTPCSNTHHRKRTRQDYLSARTTLSPQPANNHLHQRTWQTSNATICCNKQTTRRNRRSAALSQSHNHQPQTMIQQKRLLTTSNANRTRNNISSVSSTQQQLLHQKLSTAPSKKYKGRPSMTTSLTGAGTPTTATVARYNHNQNHRHSHDFENNTAAVLTNNFLTSSPPHRHHQLLMPSDTTTLILNHNHQPMMENYLKIDHQSQQQAHEFSNSMVEKL